MPHHVTINEAIIASGTSRTHLYRLAGRGLIHLRKQGRVTLVDLDEVRAVRTEVKPLTITQRSDPKIVRVQRDILRDEVVRLTGFAQRVAAYSSDAVLAREAKALLATEPLKSTP